MIYALLPAAGKSVRMGQPKLGLRLGDRTVLETVVASLRAADTGPILVVLGPHLAELASLAGRAGAEVLLLPAQTPDMRATVEQGLRWLEERFHPRPGDHWLLVPADHPTLDPQVIGQLSAALTEQPGHSIAIPSHAGKRGHPALIGWNHVAGLRNRPAEQGIDAYLRTHRVETVEVPMASRSVLLDLDTPEDYDGLLARWPPR